MANEFYQPPPHTPAASRGSTAFRRARALKSRLTVIRASLSALARLASGCRGHVALRRDTDPRGKDPGRNVLWRVKRSTLPCAISGHGLAEDETRLLAAASDTPQVMGV